MLFISTLNVISVKSTRLFTSLSVNEIQYFCKRLNHVWWHTCISKGMFCVKVSVGSWLSWHKLITSAPSFYLMYWPKHVCNHLHGLLSSLSCNLSASCNLSVRALLADTFSQVVRNCVAKVSNRVRQKVLISRQEIVFRRLELA